MMGTINLLLFIICSFGYILKIQLLNWLSLFLCFPCAIYLVYKICKGEAGAERNRNVFRLVNTCAITVLNILTIWLVF